LAEFAQRDPPRQSGRPSTGVKGTKHAGNPLPGGLVADGLADQGHLLIVAWLVVRLGVDEAVLAERLNR
jgi:hypothetical protein